MCLKIREKIIFACLIDDFGIFITNFPMTWKFDDIELHFKFSRKFCRPVMTKCLLQKGHLSIKDEVFNKLGCISLPFFKILALFSDKFDQNWCNSVP